MAGEPANGRTSAGLYLERQSRCVEDDKRHAPADDAGIGPKPKIREANLISDHSLIVSPICNVARA
jgi:hypothetical protein